MELFLCLGCLCGASQGQLNLKANLHFQLKLKGVFNYLAIITVIPVPVMTPPVLIALSILPAVIQGLSTVGKTKASQGKVRLALNHVFC